MIISTLSTIALGQECICIVGDAVKHAWFEELVCNMYLSDVYMVLS